MRGKEGKGRPAGAEREENLLPPPTLHRTGFSWSVPISLGTEMEWREASAVGAGLRALRPKKLGGEEGGDEA